MMSEVMQPHLTCKHSGVMWRDTKVLSTQSSTAWWSLSAHWARLVSKLRVQWRMKLARHHLIVWTRLHTGTFFSPHSHTQASNFPSSAHNMPPCVHTHTHTLNPVWMAWTQKTPNWSVVAATEQRVMEWGMEFKATRHAGPCGDNSQQTLWPVPVTVLSGFRDKKMHTYWHLGMKDIFLVFLLSLSLS